MMKPGGPSAESDQLRPRHGDYLTGQMAPFVDSILDITIGRFQVVRDDPRVVPQFMALCSAEVETQLRKLLKHNFVTETLLPKTGGGEATSDRAARSSDNPSDGLGFDGGPEHGGPGAQVELSLLKNQLNTCKASEMYLRSIAVDMIKTVSDKGAEVAMLKGLVERRDALLKDQRIAYIKELLHLREIVRQYRSNGSTELADAMFHAWDQDLAAEQQLEEQNKRIEAAMEEVRVKCEAEKEQLERGQAKVVDDFRRQIAAMDIQLQQLRVVPLAKQYISEEMQTDAAPARSELGCQTDVAATAPHGSDSLPTPNPRPLGPPLSTADGLFASSCPQCGFSVLPSAVSPSAHDALGTPIASTPPPQKRSSKKEKPTARERAGSPSHEGQAVGERSGGSPHGESASDDLESGRLSPPQHVASSSKVVASPKGTPSAQRPTPSAYRASTASDSAVVHPASPLSQSTHRMSSAAPAPNFDGGVVAALQAQESLRKGVEAENTSLKAEMLTIRKQLATLRKSVADKEAECAQLRSSNVNSDEIRLRQEESNAVRRLNAELREKDILVRAKTEELQKLEQETARWFANYRASQPSDQSPVNFDTVRKLSTAVTGAEAAEEQYRDCSWRLIAYGLRRKQVLQAQDTDCRAAAADKNYPALRQEEHRLDAIESHTRAQLQRLRHAREKAKREANRMWDCVLYYARSMAHGEQALEPPPYYAMTAQGGPVAQPATSSPANSPSRYELKSVLALRAARPTSAPASLAGAKLSGKLHRAVDVARVKVENANDVSSDVPHRHIQPPLQLGAKVKRPSSGGIARGSARFHPSTLRFRNAREMREAHAEMMRHDQLEIAQERAAQCQAIYQNQGRIGTVMQAQDVAAGIYKFRIYGKCEPTPHPNPTAPAVRQ